nr:hypothetical protein [Tanacetum cinerariifolium]
AGRPHQVRRRAHRALRRAGELPCGGHRQETAQAVPRPDSGVWGAVGDVMELGSPSADTPSS